MIFKIELAGKVIEIESINASVYKMCRDYIVYKDNYDFRIKIKEEDILFEEEKAQKENPGIKYAHSYLETLSVYRKIAVAMLEYETFLMHGAVFGIGERGYMITAKSGAGKTTFVQSVLENIEGSYVINGDKPLLWWKSVSELKLYACGTPWSGKERMNRNCLTPLQSIFILERPYKVSNYDMNNREDSVIEIACEDTIEKISFSDAFPYIIQQVYRPENPLFLKKVLELVGKMNGVVSIYRIRLKYYKKEEQLKQAIEKLLSNCGFVN